MNLSKLSILTFITVCFPATCIDYNTQYGLGPIMKDLGTKLEQELPEDAFVVSNVFTFPGWRPTDSIDGQTYLYHAPHCWKTEKPSKA